MRKLRKPSTHLQLSRIRNMLEGTLTCEGSAPKIPPDMPDLDKVDLMGMKPNGEMVLLGQWAMPAEMKAKETIRGLIGYGDFDDDCSDHSMWLYAFTEYAKWLEQQRGTPLAAEALGAAAELEFRASRLRRAANLVGLSETVPSTDDELMSCMGAVLGRICTEIEKLREAKQSNGGTGATLAHLCDQLEKLPRRQVKDSQTHSYIAADNVEALVEQARANGARPGAVFKHVGGKLYEKLGPIKAKVGDAGWSDAIRYRSMEDGIEYVTDSQRWAANFVEVKTNTAEAGKGSAA